MNNGHFKLNSLCYCCSTVYLKVECSSSFSSFDSNCSYGNDCNSNNQVQVMSLQSLSSHCSHLLRLKTSSTVNLANATITAVSSTFNGCGRVRHTRYLDWFASTISYSQFQGISSVGSFVSFVYVDCGFHWWYRWKGTKLKCLQLTVCRLSYSRCHRGAVLVCSRIDRHRI